MATNVNASIARPGTSEDAILAEILRNVGDELRAGNGIDLDQLVRFYPDYAGELAQLIPTMRVLAGPDSDAVVVNPTTAAGGFESHRELIGEFQIIREIGRGGMGIVYEANQASLCRRVALKVLPFAAALDSRALSRFKQESLAAAQLDHPQIVHVYSVGVDRNVHYYAMQYIEGQSLAQLIAGIANQGERPGEPKSPQKPVPTFSDEPTATLNSSTLSTDHHNNRARYYRGVALLGIQTAEALDYAHQHGIVHRDIKPGNLLLDAEGNIYITDFGVARVDTACELTMTGDLIGTLRYMSPEQATATRGLVDQRSDVYSLGATLYELLTLRPVFTANDRPVLLKMIVEEDPIPLRKLDRTIPVELETILLKCLAKESARRYPTAQELADDLARFIENKPIKARPPKPLDIARKWAKRHRQIVYLAATILVLAVLTTWGILYERAERQATAMVVVSQALDEACGRSGDARANPNDLAGWAAALAAARKAEAAVMAGTLPRELQARVIRICNDIEQQEQVAKIRVAVTARDRKMLAALDAARMERTKSREGRFDRPDVADAFAAAFRDYGIDLEVMSDEDVVRQIRERPIQQELFVAILEWWAFADTTRRSLDELDAKRLLKVPAVDGALAPSKPPVAGVRDKLLSVAIKAAADGPAWEGVIVSRLSRQDFETALLKLSDDETLPRTALVLLCDLLTIHDCQTFPLEVLVRSQRKYPDDFWLNESLGMRLCFDRTRKPTDSLPFLVAAVALLPNSPGARCNLGVGLMRNGQWDDAIAEFRRGLELAGDDSKSRSLLCSYLGIALFEKGLIDESITEHRRAVELNPNDALVRSNLVKALEKKGRFDEVITECQRALEVEPDSADWHNRLGNALVANRRLDDAIVQFQRSLDLNRDHMHAHYNLGSVLLAKGRRDDAIVEFHRTLELNPDNSQTHNNLGIALQGNGQLDEAIAEFRRSIELAPLFFPTHFNLGIALAAKGRLDEAIVEFRRSIALQPDSAEAYRNLGIALAQKGDFLASLDAFTRLHALSKGRVNWPYPSTQWLQSARQRVEFDSRFPRLIAGADQPKDAVERVALASFALVYKRQYATAARWYHEALEELPSLAKDLNQGHRYNAACAAVLAATDTPQGNMSDEERASWRRQAADWLIAELETQQERAEKNGANGRTVGLQTLQHWLKDPDLAGIRDADRTISLPELEREKLQKLWVDVRAVLGSLSASAASN